MTNGARGVEGLGAQDKRLAHTSRASPLARQALHRAALVDKRSQSLNAPGAEG